MFFSYVIRTIRARWKSHALNMIATAMVIGACAIALSFTEGLKTAVTTTGDIDNVLLMTQSARSEMDSGIDADTFNRIQALNGIRETDGQRLVSNEIVAQLVLGQGNFG